METARADELRPHLDSALKKATLNDDVVIHRHMTPTELKNISEGRDLNELAGRSYLDQGYTSGSLLSGTARARYDASGGALVEIQVPKNFHAVTPDLVKNVPGEHEVLLARDTVFKIKSVSTDSVGRTVIKVDAIKQLGK